MDDLAVTLTASPLGGWIFALFAIIVLMSYIIQAMYRGKLFSTKQVDKIIEYIRETLRDFDEH